MKTIRTAVLLLLTALTLAAQAQDEGVRFIENTPLADVLAQAREAGRNVFLDCYTSWCGPCKMMATKEFVKKEAGDYFNAQYVSTKIDMEKGEGPELARRYGVSAYPTFLILSPEGKEVGRVVGANPIGAFIASVKEATQGRALADYEADYAAGERSEQFLREYLDKLRSAYKSREANAVATDILSLHSAADVLTDTTLYAIFRSHAISTTSPVFAELSARRAELKAQHADADLAFQAAWAIDLKSALRFGADRRPELRQATLDSVAARMSEAGQSDLAADLTKDISTGYALQLLNYGVSRESTADTRAGLEAFLPSLPQSAAQALEAESGKYRGMERYFATHLARLAEQGPADKQIKKFVTATARQRLAVYKGSTAADAPALTDLYTRALGLASGKIKPEQPKDGGKSVPALRVMPH